MVNFGALLFAGFLLACEKCLTLNGYRASQRGPEGQTEDGMEKWGYVDVRTNAHMFYWLYYTYHPDGFQNRPWILWLQGGPGSSSCGYGNFEIIGPLDLNLNPRNTTWVKQASVLLVDSPVGAGYSYVDDPSAYTRDVAANTADLTVLLAAVLTRAPEFKTRPLYVFGQSYGGKVAAHFSRHLYHEIRLGNFEANLVAFAMGNAWISPIDSTLSWAPFLYWMSLTDDKGMQEILAEGQKCQDAINNETWVEALILWWSTLKVLSRVSSRVNWYNILHVRGPRNNTAIADDKNNTESADEPQNRTESIDEFRIAQMVQQIKNKDENQIENLNSTSKNPLDGLMNGPIREKLAIIPANVTWGALFDDVFVYQGRDFLKPVIDVVDDALQNTTLQVIVYQGQLDMICATKGAMDFVQKFTWSNLTAYNSAVHKALVHPANGETESFVKAHDRFKFYWILRAGHAVPKDQGDSAFRMLDRILNNLDK